MISPSLIATIGIFRMLLVPERAAARDCRNRRKVIWSGRRTDGPFQRPRVPGIVTGFIALEIRNDEVGSEDQNRKRLNKRADGNDEVQRIPAAAGLVRVDPPWHSQNAWNMHHVERQMKANQKQPEMPFAKTFAQHSAGHFWVPVIKRGKEREQNSAHNHIMKVRHDKIRQAKLPIEWRGSHHDAGQPGDEKLE